MAIGESSGEAAVPRVLYHYEANFGSVSLKENYNDGSFIFEPVRLASLDELFFAHKQHNKDPDYAQPYPWSLPEGSISDDGHKRDIMGMRCPKLIKIDVEGFEESVLRGGSRMIAMCRPLIYIENHCVKGSAELI